MTTISHHNPSGPGGGPRGSGESTGTHDRIATAVIRLERAVSGRPGFGRTTDATTTVLGEGLACSTANGADVVSADLPRSLGGNGGAPTPGSLARRSRQLPRHGVHRLRAERHGVPITSIEVTVETDSDIAGLIDQENDTAAGFLQVRYAVSVVSDAPTEQIDEILDEADRLSPLLDVYTRALDVRRGPTRVERPHPAHGRSGEVA